MLTLLQGTTVWKAVRSAAYMKGKRRIRQRKKVTRMRIPFTLCSSVSCIFSWERKKESTGLLALGSHLSGFTTCVPSPHLGDRGEHDEDEEVVGDHQPLLQEEALHAGQ